MAERIVNNKENKPIKYYQDIYIKQNISDIADRCSISYKDDKLYLRFIGIDYEITHPDFASKPLDDIKYDPLYYNHAKILILHFLTQGHMTKPTGAFVTYRDIPWGEVYFRNFEGRCIKRLAFAYGNKIDEFERACKAIGGKRLADGDISYEIPFLQDLSMRLILWAGDDEFPPSSQILFSDNFALAFTAEDIAAVGDVIIDALKKQ